MASGDAVEVVARLKAESDLSLRSHGSSSMNRALMAAGLVDRVQATLFPVTTRQNGLIPSSKARSTSTSSCSRPGSEVVQYQDAYKLCYIRGPGGLLIRLAEELG